MKKKAPIDIGDILAISLSTGPDQAIVIHCAVSHTTDTFTSQLPRNLNNKKLCFHEWGLWAIILILQGKHFICCALHVGLDTQVHISSCMIIFPLQPTIGDCVFYIENGRPAAELAAAIWLTYNRKYKKSFPVKVTDQITYNRPGIKEGTLYLTHVELHQSYGKDTHMATSQCIPHLCLPSV